MTPSAPDIWDDGALGNKDGAAFLKCSERKFRAVAKAMGWPKKYLGANVKYPLALVRAYLRSLPDEPPASAKKERRNLKSQPPAQRPVPRETAEVSKDGVLGYLRGGHLLRMSPQDIADLNAAVNLAAFAAGATVDAVAPDGADVAVLDTDAQEGE